MQSSSRHAAIIEQLVDEFTERQRHGERPSIEEYAQRYPELAEEIREIFPALGLIKRVAPSAGDLKELSPTAERAEEPQPREIGDYRILREIGRGGMGVVYEAEQQSLRRRVALKVLPRELASSDHSLRRFEREARAAARLHHTNIVPVFEVDQEGDTAFYAMQLIHGQGLDLVIADLKRLRNEHSAEMGGKQTRMAVERVMRELQSEPSADARRDPQVAANGRAAPSVAASLLSGEFQPVDLAAEKEPGSSGNGSPPATPSDDELSLPETVTADEPLESTTSAALPGDSDISTAESDRYNFYRSVGHIGLQTASALSYAHARGSSIATSSLRT